MSSAPESRVLLSIDELEAYAAEHGRCELIRGEVFHLSPSSSRHGMITARLHGYIFRYLIDHPLGELFAAETGFREPNQQTVRAPDIAFIAKDRLPTNTTGYSETMPDLVVETMSPNDTVSQTAKKTAWWLSQEGVRLVWIVDPESRQVTAHHPDGTARVVREPGKLDGGEVLPGFSLELQQLFA